ncbi:maleylpyruvate isomerase N-terminal domain-containing protein [Streptomyces sp. NPDC049040]|uniref:maleylpyruvate isomerase N-terminal domain-containing protein n=1 Tax=Streptomyces sp. NPDC049040 TaxID=3365593 RepID=UPI00371BB805
MTTSPVPRFDEWLDLIEERSAALRSVASKSPADARIPACPDWTVTDLLAHVGGLQRFWAAAVTAGPAPRPPADAEVPDRAPAGDLPEWSARSTAVLLGALRTAGADAPCWTWWADSGGASTAGTVARHHVHEVAVHVRDVQDAAGVPEPLPSGPAVDAVDEFLHVAFGSMDGWPQSPVRVALVADEGRAWTLILDETGASAVRSAAGEGRPEADATLSAPASDLLLALYRRIPWDDEALRMTGDAALIRQLVVWPTLR